MKIKISSESKFKAMIFKALADPIRLEFLYFLREEKCVCELVEQFDIVQPLVSRHLKILKDAGLIHYYKDGNKRMYQITNPQILSMIDNLDSSLITYLKQMILQEIAR
ncbi:MAG: ArsR family transcriptional regulator [Candidatus Heimdallarchaeota archaeon]|nr:ArsR family transcriptional regulator [Candidatus Heimdallarchaeota archaeon]